jgi:hypothetical protein
VILLEFDTDAFWVKDFAHRVLFSEPNCTGVPYIPKIQNADGGLLTMRGTNYAVGPNGVIYRTIRGQAQEDIVAGSEFLSGHFSTFAAGFCHSSASSEFNVIEAVPVMDLSGLVPPFYVE